jgi:hypothetical protein
VNGAARVLATTVAVVVSPAPPAAGSASHVFGDVGVLDEQAVRLAVLIDARFLAECGWDAAGQVLAPPPDHPRLGWTPPVGPARAAVSVTGCVVAGCARPSGSHGLCRAHRSRQVLRGISVEEFAADPARRALARFGPCLVTACPRDRLGGRVAYCEPHQSRWTRDRRAEPGLDVARWRRTTSPVVVTGQVSLAGMPPLITAQVLYGLQQRTRSGAHTRVQMLRMVVEDLRHAQADSVHATAPPPGAGREKRTMRTVLARHAALALSDPETEKAKDVWELAVFGLAGRLNFTAISQSWLREAAKRWALDELPRRRGNGAASVLRSLLAGVVRLSQSLRGSRPDHGAHPALLGRGDIESFLHRMSYLVSTGECSPELRAKTGRDVKRFLARIRALGLTRPGGLAAGLGCDFTLACGDVPAEPERGEPCRDLPPAIMAQLCEQLPVLQRGPSGREIRVAVELLMVYSELPELRKTWRRVAIWCKRTAETLSHRTANIKCANIKCADRLCPRNTDPKPFARTATADEILDKGQLVRTNIKNLSTITPKKASRITRHTGQRVPSTPGHRDCGYLMTCCCDSHDVVGDHFEGFGGDTEVSPERIVQCRGDEQQHTDDQTRRSGNDQVRLHPLDGKQPGQRDREESTEDEDLPQHPRQPHRHEVQPLAASLDEVIELEEGRTVQGNLAVRFWLEGRQLILKLRHERHAASGDYSLPLDGPGLVDDELRVLAQVRLQLASDRLGVTRHGPIERTKF